MWGSPLPPTPPHTPPPSVDVAQIAREIENHALTMVDVENPNADFLSMYLMGQYRFCVPAGIEWRRKENKEYETKLISHEVDAIVQHFSTLLVCNMPEYIQYLSQVPAEVRQKLKDVVKSARW